MSIGYVTIRAADACAFHDSEGYLLYLSMAPRAADDHGVKTLEATIVRGDITFGTTDIHKIITLGVTGVRVLHVNGSYRCPRVTLE